MAKKLLNSVLWERASQTVPQFQLDEKKRRNKGAFR